MLIWYEIHFMLVLVLHALFQMSLLMLARTPCIIVFFWPLIHTDIVDERDCNGLIQSDHSRSLDSISFLGSLFSHSDRNDIGNYSGKLLIEDQIKAAESNSPCLNFGSISTFYIRLIHKFPWQGSSSFFAK